ncbi:gp60 [Escherichia phage N4]|uniref:Gp60 n=5 Tax=root TaxID=1 RepID=A0MZE2_BPN4|nr:Rz-like spanin [Escherichia phage N4]AUV59064.1 hypothetical protein [Escherichia phage PMBT57]QDF14958.1 hypothetical protein AC3HA13_600 [Escherichia phage vB_EcoP_3HA13]QPN96330.1 hypothetical protein vec25_64 [Escherichia phage VEc25]CAE6410301.1 gp60 [Escherichia phage vB_Eco_Jura]ABK54421.1 gp60 [Escherichia phage N4]
MKTSLIKLTVCLLGGVALGATLFLLGSQHGEKKVQALWDEDKKEYSKELDRVKLAYDQKNREHSYEVGQLTLRLDKAKESYEVVIDSITNQYNSRLLQSEKRAESYKRQASTGTTQCLNLASHAARLDSSLEEGRRLVEELRATVRLRDNQLIELGNQIRSDRKLFE